jgi:hypothetical protein
MAPPGCAAGAALIQLFSAQSYATHRRASGRCARWSTGNLRAPPRTAKLCADGSLRGSKGNAVRAATLEAAADPATVSGEPVRHVSTTGKPGRSAATRRPASQETCHRSRARRTDEVFDAQKRPALDYADLFCPTHARVLCLTSFPNFWRMATLAFAAA